MPRIARGLADNQIYHLINRGNRREAVFHDRYDYERFLELLRKSKESYGIEIFAYCLMPNHFHLVVYTKHAESLSAAMHWIGSSYVRYYNKKYAVSGHLWQGRYKSFIVQKESYLLVLLRYVEANPRRAGIVKECADYRYSSANERVNKSDDRLIDDPPIYLPKNWNSFINDEETKIELDSIRNSITRQAPLGEEGWRVAMAKKYGLETTLNPRGRPWNKEV